MIFLILLNSFTVKLFMDEPEIKKLKQEIANTQVVILAGGKAKRMGNAEKPKALLELCGKPLIDYCIELCKNCGFKDFILLLGYKHEDIERHCGKGSKYGIKIKYSIEPENYSGKGKALKYALQKNVIDKTKRSFIIFPDDIILDKHLPIKLLLHHLYGVESLKTIATNVFASGTEYPFGVGKTDNNGIVLEFVEKPFIPELTNTGICVIETEVYPIIEDLIDLNTSESIEFEKIILPKLALLKKLYSMIVPYEIWVSINTQKEYENAERVLREKQNYK